MPEMNGFQSCKAFRTDQEFDNVPIIILSAFNDVADRTKLFELGADDYITKPFDPKELLARIQRSLERLRSKNSLGSIIGSQIPSTKLVIGQLTIDTQFKKVFINSIPVELGSIEFNLLHILCLNINELVSREDILDFVWEKQKVSTRLMDPHVLSLRSKLSGINLTIRSVYGKGYILKYI
jgi:DNA-binding response OmpR family regulator